MTSNLDTGRLTAAIDRLSRAAPFSGRLAIRRSQFVNLGGKPGAVVCVPACDEAARLPACLQSLAAAASMAAADCAFVVAVNNTTDNSFALAAHWAGRLGASAVLLDCRFAPSIAGAPHARRLALDVGALLAGEGAALLTTDADTVVDPDWIACSLALHTAGQDLVCGAVRARDDELAALPERVRRCGAIEAALFERLQRLWDAHTSPGGRPFAVRAMGASLSLPARLYEAVGRLPLPTHGEDRALAHAMLAYGLKVMQSDDVRVTTSCRLQARAAGGMAMALRSRIEEEDPFCDEALAPVAVVLRRARAWRCLVGSAASLETAVLARLLRLPYSELRSCGRAAFARYDGLCRDVPGLQAERMRMKAAALEIGLAEQALAACGLRALAERGGGHGRIGMPAPRLARMDGQGLSGAVIGGAERRTSLKAGAGD